jgi:8-oxo-dGTP pyrophosphatase MutT (NUDIX family)
MVWMPHSTVAVVCENDGRFLMVEEISHQERVFNQPAGHIEPNETILAAALRETLEETGWEVEITHLIGLYTYTAPINGVTYHRVCFGAKPIKKVTRDLDTDIIAAHWLTPEELEHENYPLRSPLVTQCINDFRDGKNYPLSFIVEQDYLV